MPQVIYQYTRSSPTLCIATCFRSYDRVLVQVLIPAMRAKLSPAPLRLPPLPFLKTRGNNLGMARKNMYVDDCHIAPQAFQCSTCLARQAPSGMKPRPVCAEVWNNGSGATSAILQRRRRVAGQIRSDIYDIRPLR